MKDLQENRRTEEQAIDEIRKLTIANGNQINLL